MRPFPAPPGVSLSEAGGAASAYLLLGVAFGFFCTGPEVPQPGSFAIGEGLKSVHTGQARSTILFDYSLVTRTTFGYGDVSPVSPTAQMLALLGAIAGQLYIAVLVARLVGLHAGQSH